jgi:hypothetical protein
MSLATIGTRKKIFGKSDVSSGIENSNHQPTGSPGVCEGDPLSPS